MESKKFQQYKHSMDMNRRHFGIKTPDKVTPSTHGQCTPVTKTGKGKSNGKSQHCRDKFYK